MIFSIENIDSKILIFLVEILIRILIFFGPKILIFFLIFILIFFGFFMGLKSVLYRYMFHVCVSLHVFHVCVSCLLENCVFLVQPF